VVAETNHPSAFVPAGFLLMGKIMFKKLLMFLGAMWLISFSAGAVILWGNDWRFGAACLVAGVAIIASAIYSRKAAS
jgi:hypothetical protein